MQKNIKDDDSLAKAVEKKRYNTFVSNDSLRKLQNIANVEFKLSISHQTIESAEEQLANLRSGEFKGLHEAELTLIEIHQAADYTRGKYAREEIRRLVLGCRRQAKQAVSYWKSQLEIAKRNGNRTEIALATAWLDGTVPEIPQTELAVSAKAPQTQHTSEPSEISPQPNLADTSRMTITDAFMAAAEVHACSESELKQLEDWVVARLALPKRPTSADAPYTAGDFPPVSQAAERTNLVSAQEELSNVARALAADPDNPSSPQLRSLIEDLHSRAGKTAMHWLERHASLDGDAETALSPADEAELERIAQFLGMTDTTDDLDALSEAGSEDSYVTSSSSDSEASPIHAAVDSDASREVRTDDALRAKPNLLNLFVQAMGIRRYPAENIVAFEARSATAIAAVGVAFVDSLGFTLPESEGRKEHLLTDFPDALDTHSFRSILDLNAELGVMRSQMRHVDSVDIKPRLADRLKSFYATLERAEDFWTDRLLELEQRAAAGEAVEEEIHIAHKWLGTHDQVAVPHVAPTTNLGGTNNQRRASSLASHLFVESDTEQMPPKRTVLRTHARMMAMR